MNVMFGGAIAATWVQGLEQGRWLHPTPGGHAPHSSGAGAPSCACWTISWRRCGRDRAGSWWCAASRAWARPRCWSTCWTARLDAAIARTAGVESEMGLAFAGLYQLCRAVPGTDRAPARSAARRALHGFNLRDGPTPDRFGGGPGRAEPAGRGGRGASAGLCRRRCALARPGLGTALTFVARHGGQAGRRRLAVREPGAGRDLTGLARRRRSRWRRSAAGGTGRPGHRRVRRGVPGPGPGAGRLPRRGRPRRGGAPLAAAGCRAARDIWDDESWYLLSARLTGLAREAGALAVLPDALRLESGIQLLAGEFAAACSAYRSRGRRLGHRQSDGTIRPSDARRLGGQAAETRQADRGHHGTDDRPRRRELATAAGWATAVLGNGLCHYDEALAAAEPGRDYPDQLGMAAWPAVELIEAAARTGRPERGFGALRRLEDVTSAAGTDWALGIEARSRALLSDDEPAERLYREAIERLGRTRVRGNWPARTCSTASGCGASAAAWTRAISSGPPTTCWPRRVSTGSPSGPGASCCPPGKPCASVPPRRARDLTAQEAQIAAARR